MELIEGQVYTLIFKERVEGGKTKKAKIRKRLKLIKKYKYHARFENEKGITTSYQYWTLDRLLKGMEV